jgi:hypothetical protein
MFKLYDIRLIIYSKQQIFLRSIKKQIRRNEIQDQGIRKDMGKKKHLKKSWSEFVWNVSKLSTTNDNNESKNSLSSGRILNFLNNSLHEALLLVPAIIPMIFFWM